MSQIWLVWYGWYPEDSFVVAAFTDVDKAARYVHEHQEMKMRHRIIGGGEEPVLSVDKEPVEVDPKRIEKSEAQLDAEEAA